MPPFLLFLLGLTPKGVAQGSNYPTIVPVDQAFKNAGVGKLKSNMRRKATAGRVIHVDLQELKTLIEEAEKRGELLMLFTVVGMDANANSVWGNMNPRRTPAEYNEVPTIIFRFGKKDASPGMAMNPSMISPLMMLIHPVYTIPYQGNYFAFGALCPPPADCNAF
jgi:hypothetical protein